MFACPKTIQQHLIVRTNETIIMLELVLENFPKVASFFDKSIPNFPVVMAVIEGNNPGRIWVDRLDKPTTCLVMTKAGYSFLGKTENVNEFLILEAIEILKANKPVKLIWEYNDSLTPLFDAAGFTQIDRIQFNHPAIINHDLTHIDAICRRLPSSCEVKQIDANLLQKSNWLSFIKLIYGSEENFLTKGYGLALLQNGELISEAIACYIGGHYVETGSVTSEHFRNQGFATIIRAFLIKESLARNLQPATSCNADNIGSAKASMKLDYVEEKRYLFLAI